MRMFHSIVVASRYFEKKYKGTLYDHVKLNLDVYLLCKYKKLSFNSDGDLIEDDI